MDERVHQDDFRVFNTPITYTKGKGGLEFCTYCGSMRPEDALTLIKGNYEVTLADMKYGWPHKLYIGGVKFYSKHLYDAGDILEDLTFLINKKIKVAFIIGSQGLRFAYE